MIYVRAFKVWFVGHLLLVFPNGLRGKVLLCVGGHETKGLLIEVCTWLRINLRMCLMLRINIPEELIRIKGYCLLECEDM